MTYKTFADLPNQIKKRILGLNQPNPEGWVLQNIPALDGRSIIETMNLQNGEKKILDFLRKIEGYFC